MIWLLIYFILLALIAYTIRTVYVDISQTNVQVDQFMKDFLEKVKLERARVSAQIDFLHGYEFDLDELILKYESSQTPEAKTVAFFTLIGGLPTEITEMNQKVTETKKYGVVFKDEKGNVAVVDGKPEWSLTDPALGTLTPSEDGLSVDLAPAGPIGDVGLHLSADADLGEGSKPIVGELPISLQPGEAVTVEIKAID